jgi:uncharacterized protein (TIGR03032 family)
MHQSDEQQKKPLHQLTSEERQRMASSGKAPPPFALINSPNIPELLLQLDCTIALTTYQAGKLIFISAIDENRLSQLPRNFRHAMALGYNGTQLAVATLDNVIVLANAPGLAATYPKQPDTYENFFAPRAAYYSGRIDLHGLFWTNGRLHGVNTLFSCICELNDSFSFVPVWKPPFIDAIVPEDRCHLNGVALHEGNPLYVTAFGTGNERESWRQTIPGGGVVIHVPSGEIVCAGLQMPHTPCMFDGKLYVLLSATSEVICVDIETGSYEVVKKIEGFIRGMDKLGEYLFIAYSRLRKNSSIFRDLEVADRSRSAGISVIHLPTGAFVGKLEYKSSVDEIFDIKLLPGIRKPGIIGTDNEYHSMNLTTPDSTFWAKPPNNSE